MHKMRHGLVKKCFVLLLRNALDNVEKYYPKFGKNMFKTRNVSLDIYLREKDYKPWLENMNKNLQRIFSLQR